MTIPAMGLALLFLHSGVWLTHQEATDMLRVDVQPKVLKKVEPVYPPQALKDGLEGRAIVKILVDTAGIVSKAEIVSSDNEVFNNPTLEAARKWRFSPALKDGHPVAVWISIPFQFKTAEKGETHSKRGAPPRDSESLLPITLDILSSKRAKEVSHLVAPDAYLIDRGTSISLYDVVTGRAKDTLLEGEKERKSTFVNTKISEGGWTATVLVKTESAHGGNPHWHTVNWEKGKDGVWTIRLWHASR